MLEWTNVEINVPNKNKSHFAKYLKLVENNSGCCKRGELMAVMGPSGCGKTTLLSALAGRIQSGSETKGSIQYDGKLRDVRKWLRMIGFVDQDDQIFEKLTVEQTLNYAACFRLKNSSSHMIEMRINELLTRFKLLHVQKNQMHKLSGGERKRVMLAIELITDPEIIFLDEPTSGLDTMTALTIIRMLKELTKNNKIIILTIHQPSVEIFGLFDKLLLMTEAKTVYYGKPDLFENVLKEKGILKREGISFPDFIAEMVVKENIYDEEQQHHQKIQEMIRENMKGDKKNQWTISCNESFRNYKINVKHMFRIYQRQLFCIFKTKKKLIKGLLFKFVFIAVIMALGNFFTDSAIETVISKQKLLDILKGDEKVDNSPATQKAFDKFRCYFFGALVLPFIFVLFFGRSVTSFFENTNVIKREIAVASYSSTSYFFGVLLCQLTMDIPTIFIICPILFLLSKNIFCGLLYFLVSINVISAIIYGASFGAMFENKILLNVANATSTVFLIVPTFIYRIIYLGLFYAIPVSMLSILKYFALLFPTFLFSSHLSALSFDLLKQKGLDLVFKIKCKIDVPEIYTKNENYSQFLLYFFDILVSRKIQIILIFSSIFFIICIASHRQATILMPSTRMKLGRF
ncbi:hypothetical protein GVAV_002725 [Gurleya vavrai]